MTTRGACAGFRVPQRHEQVQHRRQGRVRATGGGQDRPRRVHDLQGAVPQGHHPRQVVRLKEHGRNSLSACMKPCAACMHAHMAPARHTRRRAGTD